MKFVGCIVLFINFSMAKRVDYCFANESAMNLGFGVKTPYRFVSNGKIEKPSIPNCKASQIWMISRHGTRYPENSAVTRLRELPKVLREIINSHEVQKKGNLCDEDLERLKSWHLNVHLKADYSSKLTRIGFHEGRELGKRLRDAYPDLLDESRDDFQTGDYIFKSLEKERIEASMKALIVGLFSGGLSWKPSSPPEPDDVLQPNETCIYWSTPKELMQSERDRFINGRDYAELKSNVSSRLGIEVSPETIHNMQDMCRFETAWFPGILSPWCAVFSKDEWKILEYIDDLQYYYSFGYGYQVNSLHGCFSLHDLYQNFLNIENGTDGKPKGIFHFGDSKFLIYFLHALGISKDSAALLANNFGEMTNRKWKTSEISPFFSNLIATFHRCSDSAIKNKVTFHLNEKLVMYDGCDDGICDWEYLKLKFQRFFNVCKINCIAQEEHHISIGNADLLLLTIMIIVLVFCMRSTVLNMFHKIRINKIRGSTLIL